MSKRWWIIPALCGWSVGVQSQETVLPTVVVSGSTGDIEERRMAVNQKTVIDRKEIATMGGMTVSEVLTKLPGIDAGSQGSDGSQAMRARGMVRDSVQILVDGERMAGNSRMAMAMVGRLPAEEIDRIEIIRGASAEFGGAAAVTVNLIMRKAVSRSSTSLKAAAGLRDDRPFSQFTLTRNGNDGGFSWMLPLTFNHHVMLNERESERQSYSGGSRTNWARDLDQGQFTMNELVFSPRFTWRSEEGYFTVWPTLFKGLVERENRMTRSTYADPAGGTGLAPDGSRRDEESGNNTLFRLRLESERRLALGKLTTRFSANTGERKSDTQRYSLSGAGVASTTLDTLRRDENEMNGLLRLDSPANDHLLALAVEGIDLRRADRQSLAGSAENEYRSSERQWIVWAQDEYALGERLTLTGGLRGETFRLEADGQSRQDGIVAPSVALRWEQDKRWVWRTSLGSAMKMPKLDELSNMPVVSLAANTPLEPDRRGNPALRPERSVNFEAVVEHYLPADAGVFGANVYARYTEDFIERRVQQESGRWVERPYNEGDARHWGAEFDTKLKTDGWAWKGGTLRSHLTVPRSRVDDQRLGIQRAAREQPRYQLTLGMDQQLFGATSAGFNLQHYARVTTEVPGEQRAVTRDRNVLDVYALHRLDKTFNLRFNVANLLADRTRRSSQAYSGSDSWALGGSDRAYRSVMLTLEGKW